MVGFGASAEGAVDGRPHRGAALLDKSRQQLRPTEETGVSNFLPHEHRGCFWDMSVVLSCSESPVGEMVAGSWMGPSGCTRPSGHRHSWLCARASAGDVTDAGAGLMQSSLGRWGARAPSESGGATPCRHVQTWTCSCQTQEVEAIWFPLKYLNFM